MASPMTLKVESQSEREVEEDERQSQPTQPEEEDKEQEGLEMDGKEEPKSEHGSEEISSPVSEKERESLSGRDRDASWSHTQENGGGV